MKKFYLDKKNNRIWYKVKEIKGTYDWNYDGDVYYDEYVRYASLDGEIMDVRMSEDIHFDKEISEQQAKEWLHDLLNDYFIPSSTTLDNMEKGIIDGYTDPTHAGKYHFIYGENIFSRGGLVIKGTEEDREKAINKEVDITFKNLQEQILSNKNMSLTEKMVRSGLSVKKFRGELLEASRTFAAGSLGDIVFKFYKELKTYYEDLLVNQFQLFSDVNPYILGITAIEVHINGKVKYFSFGTGKNKNLAILKSLNEFDVSQAGEVQYSFELAPGLMYLMDLTENNPNHDLFEKAHEITVTKGNNTYVTGKFVPKWNTKGVDLISAGFSANDQKLIKSMQLGSDV